MALDPDQSSAIQRLAAAVVIAAARDAQEGDPEAIAWLLRDGLLWCEGAGFDLTPDVLTRWLQRHAARRARLERLGVSSRY